MGRVDLAMWAGSPSSDSASSSQSKDDSQFRDDHVADIFEDFDLYLSAKNGNLDDFRRVLDRVSAAENASYVEILSRVSHLASKAGDESMVRTLLLILGDSLRELPSASDIVAAGNNLVMAANKRGNTALLEALNYGRESVAKYWIQEFPELGYIQNKRGESALYFAAKAGFANCVSLILELCTDQEQINEQFKNMLPITAAIMMRHRGTQEFAPPLSDVLEAMFSRKPGLICFRDGGGRIPLHYAVTLGRLEEVGYVLDKYAHCATQKDNNGLCPIHVASIKGCVDIISLLLECCPAPGELLDKCGRNILHLAANYGRYNVVKYILNNPDFAELINAKDDFGNTPLHLATMGWHPKIVGALTWDKRVDVKLANDMGMTALDVAQSKMLQKPPFLQRLTWAALKAAGTPQLRSVKNVRGQTPRKSHVVDSCKERVNTLLLVSTLVATITFAAGFTMPGGYNSSATDLGMATMLRHRAFHIFVFCDSIAMHCSIVVAVALIFAQLGDLNLVLTALNLALPLLGVALSMMSMAFTAGISLVVGKLKWLSITVLVTGLTFLAILLLLFIPLCSPITSSNRILRYLSYYSFCFLIIATRSYD